MFRWLLTVISGLAICSVAMPPVQARNLDTTATEGNGNHTISGTVFDDDGDGGGAASNGSQDGAEVGIPDVQLLVEVDTDGNGSYDVSNLVTTNAYGDYSLGGILEGANVRITADPSTLPSTAYVQTGDPNGGALSNVWSINDPSLYAVDAPFSTLTGCLPGSLAGDRIAIRRHWTLDNQLF